MSGGGHRGLVWVSPLDAETPVEHLASLITPTELFFVRSHYPTPAVEVARWTLAVGGDVRQALQLTLKELKSFEVVSLTATLQCAGNGRTSFHPPAPGLQWGHGAISNAVWTGVRLRDVLERAGAGTRARHLEFAGCDDPPESSAPPFVRSIPIERGMDPTTLLAFEMNGEPLIPAHGGPLRLIVPGWTGQNWLKWVRSINVQAHATNNHYMREYSLPAASGSRDVVPITENAIKSIIARPLPGESVPSGPVTISGVALTGSGSVEKVEVSVNGRPWQPAELQPQESPGAWQQWRCVALVAERGPATVAARATDTLGRTQPETTPPNPGGYLWNAVARVEFDVTG